MLAAGVLTGPLGLMTVLDTQAVLYLVTGIIAAGWMTERGAHRRVARSPSAQSLRMDSSGLSS
jgi:hypothetical protein